MRQIRKTRAWLVTSVLTLLFLQACGGSSDDESDPAPTPSPGSDTTLERVANTSCLVPPSEPDAVPQLNLIPAFPDLPNLAAILGMFQPPGNNDLWYAILKEGRVVRFNNRPDVASVETVLDIRERVRNRGEMGLLGFAFHPQFAANGEFFISYNDVTNNGESVIARYTEVDGVATPAGEERILTLEQPATNHNGGGVAFGPDGYLYIGFGDGGGANDAYGNGQNTLSWHGTLLRIDVDSGSPYSIPADNPFVADNNFLPEIYAWGLRNPWRWSFDIQNNDLWVADVGQNRIEEVSRVAAGDNLGWPIMEGSRCFTNDNCDQSGLTLPVAEYPHERGDCSVSGGYVYRGTDISALQGSYIFADFCSGRIRRTFPVGDNRWQSEELLTASSRNIAGFAQANNGEIYALDIGAVEAGQTILTFEAMSGGGTTIAERLSQTGCFASTLDKTPAAAVIGYEVSSPLWSDGAEKQRFFAIPDGQEISVSSDGDFIFPAGSILIKHFMASDVFIETRLLLRRENGWAGYSYEWLADQSDALLLDDGKLVDTGAFIHTIPSRDACFECHTGASGISLGLEAGQLNNERRYHDSAARENQLSALFHAGYLDAMPSSERIPSLPDLNDQSASVTERARSYLHSNCSGCHRPGAQGAALDLRVQTSLRDTGTCDVAPANGDFGLANAKIVAVGDPDTSVLLARMLATDEHRMPPLASLIVDTAATEIVSQWISQISTCGD